MLWLLLLLLLRLWGFRRCGGISGLIVGPLHHEQLGHELDEHLPHPGRHVVRGWRPVNKPETGSKNESHCSTWSYRKCTLRMPTVTMMDNDTSIIVKSRYFPSRGTAKDVGGMISASSKKNTVSDSKMEIQRVT